MRPAGQHAFLDVLLTGSFCFAGMTLFKRTEGTVDEIEKALETLSSQVSNSSSDPKEAKRLLDGERVTWHTHQQPRNFLQRNFRSEKKQKLTPPSALYEPHDL
jgi:hypothetical protein